MCRRSSMGRWKDSQKPGPGHQEGASHLCPGACDLHLPMIDACPAGRTQNRRYDSSSEGMMVRVVADGQELANAAAELFSTRAIEAASTSGRFSVALSGGTTPRLMYDLLARPPLRDRVPW